MSSIPQWERTTLISPVSIPSSAAASSRPFTMVYRIWKKRLRPASPETSASKPLLTASRTAPGGYSKSNSKEFQDRLAEAERRDASNLDRYQTALSQRDDRFISDLQSQGGFNMRFSELVIVVLQVSNNLPATTSARLENILLKDIAKAICRVIGQSFEGFQIGPSVLNSLEVEFNTNAPIGRGASGKVYTGKWNGAIVAVKRMHVDDARAISEEQRQAISHEVKIWSSLQHPNVLAFYGACLEATVPFIVMKFCPFGDIAHYLDIHPNADRTRLAYEVALALAYLHSRNIVHADVKAANVLVGEDHHALLTDFGLSLKLQQIRNQSSYSRTVDKQRGTLLWMAPEVLEGTSPDMTADVYSLGMTIWEIFSGQIPFGSVISDHIFIYNVVSLQRRPKRPDRLNSEDMIWNVIEKCWIQDRQSRPAAEEVVRWLQSLLRNPADAQGEKPNGAVGPIDLRVPDMKRVPQPMIGPASLDNTVIGRIVPSHSEESVTPILQLTAGPMLRYDTVDENGIWHGAALIVTADAGSAYEPSPTLIYISDPSHPATPPATSGEYNGQSNIAIPHLVDPLFNVLSAANDVHTLPDRNTLRETVPGQEIFVYVASGGTFTFWRFMIHIPLGPVEMRMIYSINGGQEFNFVVPGRNQNMRWAAYSRNSFSAGVNQNDFRGPGFQSGYDPVWSDVLQKHAENPFHVLVGAGGQIYSDAIISEPELQEWASMKDAGKKNNCSLSLEMHSAIDQFYFHHYCRVFGSGAFSRANSSIPMLNMLDDHDLVSALHILSYWCQFKPRVLWRSMGTATVSIYIPFAALFSLKISPSSDPDETMRSPVFRSIGSRGYFFFLLFQCFINIEVDGLDVAGHPFRSLVIGTEGPYAHFPSHSFLTYMGPKVYMLLLDCRAERKQDQVCSQAQYANIFQRLEQLPRGTEHLIVQLGIPIAYPRMVFLETALEAKLNPLVALGRAGSLGRSGLVNKFNTDAELLDDLNDHWTAKAHKLYVRYNFMSSQRERNWFIERLQQDIATGKHIRVTFLSGNVQLAAVGLLKTYVNNKDRELPPAMDHRYMLNIVTSAIVDTPPPNGVLAMLSSLSTKTHKTLHHLNTDETMVPIFVTDTQGRPSKSKYIMGKRNWCAVDWDPSSADLVFDIRVEKERGYGETVGYTIRAPPPRWS
ncbi:hypothetical protein NM688_g4254 [Phlebia brevispora]|uniref:Uncharacterized protein n=1 Tax=Phlebia brevispora TaxID=194682 RepID=A0ACC1T3N7_9APHY|nr:hypothetical protein NM688_g4254 [Phlebia brevispora]